MKPYARSRRMLYRRITRIKREGLVLSALLSVYFAGRLFTNLVIFHPVPVLASMDNVVVTVEQRVPVIKEVEVDRTFKSEKQQILAYIVEKFGDRAADAITLIHTCENSTFNPRAINHNRNGTVDRGVFQINSIHGGEDMFDWKTNVDMAYTIYRSRGNKFTAWTCAHTVGEKNYLGQ